LTKSMRLLKCAVQDHAAGRSSAWLERSVRDAEVAGSNPVAPTIFRNEPFGEHVEGLSCF
jgi:hypothetical protein